MGDTAENVRPARPQIRKKGSSVVMSPETMQEVSDAMARALVAAAKFNDWIAEVVKLIAAAYAMTESEAKDYVKSCERSVWLSHYDDGMSPSEAVADWRATA